jgi:hypothetical protein
LSTLIALLFLVQSIPVNPSVKEVVTYLVGVMDTTAQARENPQIAKVQMTTCEVSLAPPTDSIYLYQEQAIIDKLNQPYRQRVLEITPANNPGTVKSIAYKLQNPGNFINLCNKNLTERQLSKTAIGEWVCTVLLTPIEGGFRGETPPEGCPTTARGAVKITNTIMLRPDSMDTSDRGYNAAGQQIWGARDNFYQFRRVYP